MSRYFRNGCKILVIDEEVVGIANLFGYYYKDGDEFNCYTEGYYDLENKCEVDLGNGYGVKWGTSDIYNEAGGKVIIEDVEDAIMEGVFYWDGHNHKFIELISDTSEYEEVEIEIVEDQLVVSEYTITTGSKTLQKIKIDGDETYAIYSKATAYAGDWCDEIYVISDDDAQLIIKDENFSSFNVNEK